LPEHNPFTQSAEARKISQQRALFCVFARAGTLSSFTPSARPAYKNIYGIISWMETKSFFMRNKSRSDFSLSLAMEKIEGARSCDAFLLSLALSDGAFRLR
jgi:hypothetical protein